MQNAQTFFSCTKEDLHDQNVLDGCWTSWYMFPKRKKTQFTSFQSVYSCLSVYRHNVSPHFHNHCLFQLSSFHKNTCQFYVTRQYMETRSNIKTLHFLEKLRSTSAKAFHSATQEPSNRSLPFFSLPHKFYIDIQIFSLTSIFIKCNLCRIFTQWVTFLYL